MNSSVQISAVPFGNNFFGLGRVGGAIQRRLSLSRWAEDVENEDLLLTIAEVAVAFAGFASIVSVLGRRSSDTPEYINALRMRAMILSSLLAVAFSILPFVLHSYGLTGGMLWRTSSAVLLLASTGLAYSILSRIFAVPATATRRTWIAVVVFATLASTVLTAGANALGATGTSAAAVYLTSIALLLFLAGFVFSFILISFLAPISRES